MGIASSVAGGPPLRRATHTVAEADPLHPASGAPVATIIVVTHNSARWLERQRAALEEQEERRWRLIVVDNASDPPQRPDAARLPAGSTLIQSGQNLGFAAANNLAAADATTPYLVFLNPDAFPEPTWLAALIAAAERFPSAGAIGSTQLRADSPGVADGLGDVMHASGIAYRSGYGQRIAGTLPLAETFSACAAGMLVPRGLFEAVGGFDERYFCYFEDVDLGFRLRLHGCPVLQSPDAVIAHVGGGSAGVRTPFAEFHGARNRLWTFVKCMPSPLLWLLFPAHLGATALLLAAATIHGRGFDGWRGFLAGWRGLGAAWEARRAVQQVRRASTWEIAKALAWSPDVFLTRRAVLRPLRQHSRCAPRAAVSS